MLPGLCFRKRHKRMRTALEVRAKGFERHPGCLSKPFSQSIGMTVRLREPGVFW